MHLHINTFTFIEIDRLICHCTDMLTLTDLFVSALTRWHWQTFQCVDLSVSTCQCIDRKVMWTCWSVNVSTCQCVNASTEKYFNVNMWICQCVNMWICQCVNMWICQCVNLSMSLCQCIDRKVYQCQYVDLSMLHWQKSVNVNMSMCRYVNVSTCQPCCSCILFICLTFWRMYPRMNLCL